MTHNQFPAYEFEPTLTTSELYNARINDCAEKLRKRFRLANSNYADVAKHFDGNFEKAAEYCYEHFYEYGGIYVFDCNDSEEVE